jgi:hypothetical protein
MYVRIWFKFGLEFNIEFQWSPGKRSELGRGLGAGDLGTYLATFTGDTAVVIPRGLVTTHYAELVFV